MIFRVPRVLFGILSIVGYSLTKENVSRKIIVIEGARFVVS